MHRLAILGFLSITVVCASAGPISVNFDPPSIVFDAVSRGISQWSSDPTGTCSGTSDNQCCTGSPTDTQCESVASSFRVSRDFWTRRIYTCLRGSVNWQCEEWNDSRGIQQMGCETIPATESVVLADVATCLSAESLLP